MSKRESDTAELRDAGEAKKPRVEEPVVPVPVTYNIHDTIQKSPKMHGGKHTGKMYITIVYSDPSYCNWVMSLNDGNSTSAMMKFRSWLIERCKMYIQLKAYGTQ